MSVDFRIVAATVALFVASPLKGGQRYLAATVDTRELSVSQVIDGAKISVPIEVTSGANGDLYFRAGPLLPGNPLLAEYVFSEAPATVLRASVQHAR
jgi:hypothetical protein